MDDGRPKLSLVPPTTDDRDDVLMRVDTTPRDFCQHLNVIFRRESRRVVCRTCDREVDAFDYLVKIASFWERLNYERKRALDDASAAKARLDDILRQERNARARLARLTTRLEDEDD